MKRRSTPGWALGVVIAAALIVVGCADEYATTPSTPSEELTASESQLLDRHVFVLIEERAPSGDLELAIRLAGGTISIRHDVIGVFAVTGLTDEQASTLGERSDVDAISRDISVQWIPPAAELMGEQLRRPEGEFDDPSTAFFFAIGSQWNLTQIDADDAWPVTSQGEGARVAVLDTGTDPFHQELDLKIDPASTSVLTAGSSPCGAFDEDFFFDLNFHGSFVSGLITGNGVDMASVAPHATIIGVKVLNCFGSGSFGDVISGIMYAAGVGADVINMSLGFLFVNSPSIKGLKKAIERAVKFARKSGTLTVAAAGNDGVNLDDGAFIHLPSQAKGVVSIGATAPIGQVDFDLLASYTNFGKKGVDVMAPGGDLVAGGTCKLLGIDPFGPGGPGACDLVLSVCSSFVCGVSFSYLVSAGTSFASPLGAGLAAVIQSERTKKKKGKGDPKRVENCLYKGADDLGDPRRDPLYGRGRLNVLGSVSARGC